MISKEGGEKVPNAPLPPEERATRIRLALTDFQQRIPTRHEPSETMTLQDKSEIPWDIEITWEEDGEGQLLDLIWSLSLDSNELNINLTHTQTHPTVSSVSIETWLGGEMRDTYQAMDFVEAKLKELFPIPPSPQSPEVIS